MPRLPPNLLNYAHTLHPCLPLLLRPCRDLPSARNELRWLQEHVIATKNTSKPRSVRPAWQIASLRRLCVERSMGKPLQYILGDQPFGELSILCEPGVLIPRPETESLTTYLASLIHHLKPQKKPLRILDLCTGTGCIPLLLNSILAPSTPALRLLGVDNSPAAISSARKNLEHNITLRRLPLSARDQIRFLRDDIFDPTKLQWPNQSWDILISNPPYISPDSFNKTTARCVRNHEPISALVPSLDPQSTLPDEAKGDIFYPHLLSLANSVQAKIILFEVADMAQAERVVHMVLDHGWEGVEIWRDWPAQGASRGFVTAGAVEVNVIGEGNGRGVIAWRRGVGTWIGKAE